MGRKAHPLAARIKKMMQTDEDVGKISQATPVMIARAMELFLQRLCSRSAEVAVQRKARTLTTSHLKAYVSSDELMDFLADTVAKAPDLPPEGEADAPKPKRQRTGESKREQRASGEDKRVSADGSGVPAAAAAAPAAAAPAAAPAAAAAAAAADAEPDPHGAHFKVEALKAEDTGSPTACKVGHGFGGLGAHPFLAARSFGRPGGAAATKRGTSSCSPQPEGPQPQQPAQHAAADEQAVRGGSPADVAAAAEEQQAQAAGEAAPLPLLPGMSLQMLASLGSRQQVEYDDDYDS